jgi:oxygen-independent coproporphyrinogen III oxidase
MINSVYIHIPFCRHICTYCDFCKMFYNETLVEKYLNQLEKEINDKYMHEEISTLYIGGGTPSALSSSALEHLLKIIKIFNLKTNYEFTFECNIYDINETLLKILKENGVNRLSIGIESFDKSNLALMDRITDYNDTLHKIDLCRHWGFNNINLDLIYALPNETLWTLKRDLNLLLKLNPEHISTYSLIIEDNTLLKIKGYHPINQDLDYKMYHYIVKKLKFKNYEHYEISNFAKKDKYSRHNLNCWNNEEYYGFGLGAAGYFAGVRYQNTRSLTDYLQNKIILDQEIVPLSSKMKYEIMLGLRKTKGINLVEFETKYGQKLIDVFNLEKLLKEKALIIKNNYLFINPKKLYVMNEILLKIL